MKILITGYTTRMFGSTRVIGDYITFSYLLEAMLKDMGHEVERRIVTLDEEDLGYKYDFAFCGVAPLSSISAHKVPETHNVMELMPGRHAVYADDWSFCGYGNSVRYTLDRWAQYLNYKQFPYPEDVMERTKEHMRSMMVQSNPAANSPVLCPMFRWGNHEYLMKDNYAAFLTTLDPSQWVKFPTISIPGSRNKIRQWVCAALSDHHKWVERQKFSFPVVYIGNKRKNVLLPESEAIRYFAASYGILSVGYPSAGCGWWRTRYLNASWGETLVYSDPRDANEMGEPYRGSAEWFESLYGTIQYDRAVEDQREWLNENVMQKEEALAILAKLIAK